MVRPQRQRRRQVVDDSEDDDTTNERSETSKAPVIVGPPHKTPKKHKPAHARSDVTPTKPIYSFFNAATQQQRNTHPPKGPDLDDASNRNRASSQKAEEISDDEFQRGSKASSLGKRLRDPGSVVNPSDGAHTVTIRPASKFLKGIAGRVPSDSNKKIPLHLDQRPWAEKYAPGDINEVVVHKKKIEYVRLWLQGAFSGAHRQKVLIVKGPAGSGKTVTVTALAKELDYDVIEWRNPASSGFGVQNYVSAAAAFEDFIIRRTRGAGLELVQDTGSTEEPQRRANAFEEANSRQLILVEEFPTMTSQTTASLEAFRSTILQYLASGSQGQHSSQLAALTPIVIIVTESSMSFSVSSTDSLTVHRLLGRDVLGHPSVGTIEFNSVAPTFVLKALGLVINKHQRLEGGKVTIGTQVLKKIAEVADLRNAVSLLEYVGSTSDTSAALFPASLTKAKPKTRTKRVPDETNFARDETAMKLIAMREGSIGLFHAIGKIVYNKRGEAQVDATSGGRPASEVDLESLIGSTGADTSTFLCGLHENYLPSCFAQGGNAQASLDAANACLDALCEADLLSSSLGAGRGAYSATEGVRQDEVAFQVGCRGVLDGLPHPVHRQALTRSLGKGRDGKALGRGDAHKMYYPYSLKLWRPREEVQAVLRGFAARQLSGQLDSEIMPIAKLWSRAISQPGRVADDGNRTTAAILPSGTSTANEDLALERLPYLYQLLPKDPKVLGIEVPRRLVEDLERLVQFGLSDDVEGESEDSEGLEDVHGSKMQRSRVTSAGRLGGENANASGLGVDKLVLSDDDIEDY